MMSTHRKPRGRAARGEQRTNPNWNIYFPPEEAPEVEEVLSEYQAFQANRSLFGKKAIQFYAKQIKEHGLDPRTLEPAVA